MPNRKKKPLRLALPKEESHLAVRKRKNQEINQRLLREKIAAGNHHHHILTSIEELGKLDAEVKEIKNMDKPQQAKYMTRLAFLKTKLDAQFKLLNKYLPDLRSLEFRDEEGENPFASAAKAWAEALQKQ